MGEKMREQGAVEVEVMIILPVAILSAVMLLYLSLFLFQRAQLQASLETCAVYYKSVVTDTYVAKKEILEGGGADGTGIGNTYSEPKPLNPYRGMFGDGDNLKSKELFEKYFYSVAGGMLFHDDLELDIDYSNYVILKQFEVTASQRILFPLDLSMLGIDRDYSITATARVAVVDHDSMIRNLDYAIDLLEDTKLGELAQNLASKIGEAYTKIKEVLGG